MGFSNFLSLCRNLASVPLALFPPFMLANCQQLQTLFGHCVAIAGWNCLSLALSCPPASRRSPQAHFLRILRSISGLLNCCLLHWLHISPFSMPSLTGSGPPQVIPGLMSSDWLLSEMLSAASLCLRQCGANAICMNEEAYVSTGATLQCSCTSGSLSPNCTCESIVSSPRHYARTACAGKYPASMSCGPIDAAFSCTHNQLTSVPCDILPTTTYL